MLCCQQLALLFIAGHQENEYMKGFTALSLMFFFKEMLSTNGFPFCAFKMAEIVGISLTLMSEIFLFLEYFYSVHSIFYMIVF